MKITAICSSPRAGNTEYLSNKLLQAVESKGAETELILLREKYIEQCLGCDTCYQTHSDCVIDDNMNEIAENLNQKKQKPTT